jgi:hypothetical protein
MQQISYALLLTENCQLLTAIVQQSAALTPHLPLLQPPDQSTSTPVGEVWRT